MENKKLTPKQLSFCEHYLSNGLNATAACVSAGYSEKTATEIGSENLTKPNIQAYIQSKQAETSKKLEVTKESLIELLMKIANGSKVKESDKINSVKQLSQMLGFNSPTKIENKHTINTSIKDLMGFDDE